MSRIEQAMRRASGELLADGSETHPPVGPRPAGRSEPVALENYPKEGAAARKSSGDETRAAAVAAPSPAIGRSDNVPTSRPVVTETRSGALSVSGLEPSLVVGREMPPVAVEQFRRLAATVHEQQLQSGLKTLMVTSAVPEEGKTLSILNLALTLAESFNRRVLLIDADLRRPSLHRIFGFANTSGLSEWLRAERNDLPVHAVSPRLSVLPGGHPDTNPMAGLTSARMIQLLADASAQYDWVLIDAPPVLLLPDAQLLSRVTQAVIFVIRAGTTPLASIQKAIAAVGSEFIIGTVLNRAEEEALPSVEGYDRYSSHHSGE